VAVKRRSPPAEDSKDLTEYLGGRLAPCWLGRPHSRKRDSRVDQQGKHTNADSEDQQYVSREGCSEGSRGKRKVHDHDDAGGRDDGVLSPERCGTLEKNGRPDV
jgi:hypothetical protein